MSLLLNHPQTLFGFERIHVKAGETVNVNIYPSLLDFTYTDLNGKKVQTLCCVHQFVT